MLPTSNLDIEITESSIEEEQEGKTEGEMIEICIEKPESVNVNNEESEEIEQDEEYFMDDEDMSEEDKFAYSSCNCKYCEAVKAIESKWCTWVPNSMLEQAIKKTIDTKF